MVVFIAHCATSSHKVASSSPVQGIYLFSVSLKDYTPRLDIRCCNVRILRVGMLAVLPFGVMEEKRLTLVVPKSDHTSESP